MAGFAAWEGFQREASASAHWSVASTVAGVALVTLVAGRRRQHSTTGAWLADAGRSALAWRGRPGYSAGVAVWALLLLTTVGWDLNSFVHQAHDLPTLSYYVGRVTRFVLGRTFLFALWLAAGAGLALGCLARRRTADA